MYEDLNPFEPSAGTAPPEMAGRDDLLHDAHILINRVGAGRVGKPTLFTGFRGVGKTVLLRAIRRRIEEENHVVAALEAPEDKTLAELLYPPIHKGLAKLSRVQAARQATVGALRALKSFAQIREIKVGDVSIAFDPDPAQASTGDFESDLSDLLVAVGRAAQAANKGFFILLDEVQFLDRSDLSALIVSLHTLNQEGLPVQFFGAGLPQIRKQVGDAKTYSERLFTFPEVGALSRRAVYEAVREPITDAGEVIDDRALERIYADTDGYPFFVQEWGFQAWNAAPNSPITENDVIQGAERARLRLDKDFYRTRYDQLSPREQDYVHAMASLGEGPYEVAEVAAHMGLTPPQLAVIRKRSIVKGVIYSPTTGKVDFTVPRFGEFLQRQAESDNPLDFM